MTNTLHRYGSGESFSDDYSVFAIPARGFNDNGAVEKLRQFLEIARKYKPVNMGDASHGSIFRPSKELNPTVHWRRDLSRDFDSVVSSVSCTTTVAAVFDNQDQAVAFIQELKEADLGLSINISTALDKAQRETTSFAMRDVAWQRWNNTHPFIMRHGVLIESLDSNQRALALGLVAFIVLGAPGAVVACGVLGCPSVPGNWPPG